ncbi:hypothetical protein TSUD_324960 [Trifolium subterraneum]|uniref:Uncharacterized protein n=1 Tax=Trifolium subterraneum TaxID=3900 RepID=A0A2Z6P0S1_TRISU|nr:hypothetical protein TSUD_324960 [Trifolium subterraneum]
MKASKVFRVRRRLSEIPGFDKQGIEAAVRYPSDRDKTRPKRPLRCCERIEAVIGSPK